MQGAPILINLMIGGASGHPDLALATLGYTPKDTTDAENAMALSMGVLSSFVSFGRGLQNYAKAESAIKSFTSTASMASSINEYKGYMDNLIFFGKESANNISSGNMNIVDFSGSTPATVDA